MCPEKINLRLLFFCQEQLLEKLLTLAATSIIQFKKEANNFEWLFFGLFVNWQVWLILFSGCWLGPSKMWLKDSPLWRVLVEQIQAREFQRGWEAQCTPEWNLWDGPTDSGQNLCEQEELQLVKFTKLVNGQVVTAHSPYYPSAGALWKILRSWEHRTSSVHDELLAFMNLRNHHRVCKFFIRSRSWTP